MNENLNENPNESMNETVRLYEPGFENQTITQPAAPPPLYKLWNPIGFIVVSVLLSFLPAAILYALNYGRLGQSKKRNIILLVSFAVFAGMVAVVVLIDLSVFRYMFYALYVVAGVLMYRDQEAAYQYHVFKGGRKASYLVPVIVSVAVVVVTIVVAVIMLFQSRYVPQQKIQVMGSDLYYTQTVTKSEAEKLGNYLSSQGFFTEGNRVAVKLDKKADTYEFSLIVDQSKLNDEDIAEIFQYMSMELSQNVFDNHKVDIELCDNTFKSLKTITAD